jgi:hypothetical protein
MEGGMGLDERGARKTTHLIEATYVAHGDARTCKAHENQRSGGIGSGRGGTSLLCLFVDIKRERSGDYTRVCTTFGLVLSRPRAIRAKSIKASCAEGTFVRRTNDFNIWGRPTARISEPIGQGASAAKRDVSGRAVKSCAPIPPFGSSRRIVATPLTGRA